MKPELLEKPKAWIVTKRIVFEQEFFVPKAAGACTEQDAIDQVWNGDRGEEIGELKHYRDADTDQWEVRKAYEEGIPAHDNPNNCPIGSIISPDILRGKGD